MLKSNVGAKRGASKTQTNIRSLEVQIHIKTETLKDQIQTKTCHFIEVKENIKYSSFHISNNQVHFFNFQLKLLLSKPAVLYNLIS